VLALLRIVVEIGEMMVVSSGVEAPMRKAA
jgi:hypothetical protein